MAEVGYDPDALDDIARLDQVHGRRVPIEGAAELLADHPLIGRPTEDANLHELVISHGKTGSAALYHFDEANDVVVVLAVRHAPPT